MTERLGQHGFGKKGGVDVTDKVDDDLRSKQIVSGRQAIPCRKRMNET